MAQMTMRQRMLGVIKGQVHDRVPFVQYSGIAAPNEEVWQEVGRGNMGILQWSAVHGVQHPNCRMSTEDIAKDGVRGRRTTLHTPAGTLVEESFISPALGSSAIHQHFVREPADYEVLLAYMRDAIVVEAHEPVRRIAERLGDDGLPLVNVGRTPYQQLWVQWVSLQDLSYHLADCPDVVRACMDEMGRVLRDIFEVVRTAPIDFVDFGDNITAPTVGPRHFVTTCVPYYNELADMLADRDIPVFVHMDGDLRPLAAAIADSRVRGIDSFSPPPDNDMPVDEALKQWPQMRLLVNYPSSVHLREPRAIYERAMSILEEGGRQGRLQIQVSENVPPGMWRKSYPQIVRAIKDFGAAC